MLSKQKRFDMLVNALYADVYRYAFWICKNQSMAEDLVQETYLRAWKSFENLQDETLAKAWLFTIVRRENARKYERIQPELVSIDETDLSAEGLSPVDHGEYSIIQKHILGLALEFREPLVLQLVGGFSAQEISNILQVNKNTVLTRLFRARNQMKKILTDKTVSKARQAGGLNDG